MSFETKVFLVVGIFWVCVAIRVLRWFVNLPWREPKPSRWRRTIGPIESKDGQLPLALSPAIRGNLKRPNLPKQKPDWSTIPTAEEIYGHTRRP